MCVYIYIYICIYIFTYMFTHCMSRRLSCNTARPGCICVYMCMYVFKHIPISNVRHIYVFCTCIYAYKGCSYICT